MDIIKTGTILTKTIRNVGRFKEIVVIFAKHGFDEFMAGGVSVLIPNFVVPRSKRSIREDLQEKNWQEVVGHRLRMCFEELGPAFIKFGQLLSSREDILDPAFIKEMKMLRDKVKPVPFSEVKEEIEKSLGKKTDEVFLSFDEKPIGTASIGVVYSAVLKSGEKVVVKVKRPNIERMMETDFSILKFLCQQAEKVSDEVRYAGISRIVTDFEASLMTELNFYTETFNCKRFKKAVISHNADNLLYVPHVYDEYSSRDIIIMEKLEGTPFSDHERIEDKLDVIGEKLEEGYRTFIKTFLQDGFFHADLHGGNFFLLDDGKIGLIDFGLMGTLSKKGRKNFISLIYALITFNYENVVYEFLDVAEYKTIPDIDDLVSDVRNGLSPYIGLTAAQTDFTEVLRIVIQTLKKHEIFLPREWFIVFRALMTLDGVGRSIGKDFDVYSMMEDDIQELIRENFSKDEIIEEAAWAAKDFATSARLIPRHLKWFLKDWSRKKYAFNLILTGHEKSLMDLTSGLVFLGYIILSCVFLFSGVGFITNSSESVTLESIPSISWVFWILSSLSFVLGQVRLRRK